MVIIVVTTSEEKSQAVPQGLQLVGNYSDSSDESS